MRDDFAVSLEADDGAESSDRLNERLTEPNPPISGSKCKSTSFDPYFDFLPSLPCQSRKRRGKYPLCSIVQRCHGSSRKKGESGRGRAKGEVRTGKNPAQYSALSANRLHSLSGKIASSLFPSSAVALSGCFLVAHSLVVVRFSG